MYAHAFTVCMFLRMNNDRGKKSREMQKKKKKRAKRVRTTYGNKYVRACKHNILRRRQLSGTRRSPDRRGEREGKDDESAEEYRVRLRVETVVVRAPRKTSHDDRS